MIRCKNIALLSYMFLAAVATLNAQEESKDQILVTVSPTCATPRAIQNLSKSKSPVVNIEVVEPSKVYQSVVYSQHANVATPLLHLAEHSTASKLKTVLPGLNTQSIDLNFFEVGEELDSEKMLRPMGEHTLEIHEFPKLESLPEPERHEPVVEGNVDAIPKNESLENDNVDKPIDAKNTPSVSMNLSDDSMKDLKPMGAWGNLDSISASGSNSQQQPWVSENLIIHPPFIQPFNRDRYTFVVENKGDDVAYDVTVEIQVPSTARIVAALPANSIFSSRSAVFQFANIGPGEKTQVHLNAVPSDSKDSVSFVAKVASKSTFEFDASDNFVMNLSDTKTDSIAPESRPVAQETAANKKLPATVITNPYFQGQPDRISNSNVYGQRR